MNGAIPARKVYQAVGIIIDQISHDLINDTIVSVRRFGTLSPHKRMGHMANDLSIGKVRMLPGYRSVKFHAHEGFLSLLADREDRFRNDAQ